MKRSVKLIGKNYDVLLEEGKKVITIKNYEKDGSRCPKTDRSWKTLEEVVEDYKYYGFVVEA